MEGAKDQVAGERGADGDFGGFEVAHFPDHDDVGVATEDGTKAGGEGEVDFGADGDLHDAGEFVFDGVFDGDDAAVLGIELGEEGVEGGGFAGAGGAGNEDDPVGFFEQGFGFAAKVGLELEAVEVEFFLAEKSQGDAFAFDGGDGGDADVDELATDLEVDPAILGEAAFGDVELGHDLEAGEHRLLELLDVFGNGDFAEATVDAVAHAEFFLHGFDVNIGGVLFESLADDLVHEFDDRGFFVIGVDDVGFVALFQVGGIDIATFEDFFEGVGADAVEVAEGIEEPLFRGETPADGDGDFAGDGLAGDEVEGVVGGEDELAKGRCALGSIGGWGRFFDGEGEELMTQGDPGREEAFEFGAVGRVWNGHVNPRHAQAVSEIGEEGFLIDLAVVQDLSDDRDAWSGGGERNATATGCLQALGEGLSDTFHEGRSAFGRCFDGAICGEEGGVGALERGASFDGFRSGRLSTFGGVAVAFQQSGEVEEGVGLGGVLAGIVSEVFAERSFNNGAADHAKGAIRGNRTGFGVVIISDQGAAESGGDSERADAFGAWERDGLIDVTCGHVGSLCGAVQRDR